MDIGEERERDDRLYCATLVMTDRNGKVTLETDEHLSPIEAIAALSALARMIKVSPAPGASRPPAPGAERGNGLGNDRVKGSVSD